ncbi:uncharacterized protein PRCAT00001293001 [Priceomyces carsonii]|uniref:uncharacterized protein n=1 Tax=Priceomyces carsonii TaxID=28549 RepID=UPI002ED891BD|nr:unnamed protein product [Priceomyces carsonii]
MSDGERDTTEIFEHLDTGLVELFMRNQQAELFANVPVNEHNRRLDQLNRLLSERRLREHSNNHFIEIRHGYGGLPFPFIRWDSLLRDYNPTTMARRLGSFARWIWTNLSFWIAFLFYFLFIVNRTIRTIIRIGSMVTFSNNWVRDIHTYLFGNTVLLETYRDLFSHNFDIFYFLDGESAQNESNLKIFYNVFLNWLAANLSIDGMHSTDEGYIFSINDDTLIFRFSKVFQVYFGLHFNKTTIKLITISAYLFYIAYGIMIFSCFTLMFNYNVARRVVPAWEFFQRFSMLVNRAVKSVA